MASIIRPLVLSVLLMAAGIALWSFSQRVEHEPVTERLVWVADAHQLGPVGYRDPAGKLGGEVFITHSAQKAQSRINEACGTGCFSPAAFTIVDATGRQVTAQLLNIPGTAPPPTPPTPPVVTALTITPASQAIIVGPLLCPGKTFAVLVTGGTPSYNVFLGPPGTVTNPSSGVYNVTITAAGTTTVNVIDSGTPQQAKSATISCS